ncbi:11-beta-hydroxysteroid dehydrogenase type 2 isoform X1 [Patella vulgata]|uniref:11-beta-hydroxysteroid dehydrogenase type 2 isoform X1 n=1 Tax=Patella vulgata TaxID=6465 RepID=UPI0024A95E9D|nr:11-beta-hydroxysteroid dehydrogenase type 2 isoform X1 [Patella vulgata]
MARDIIIIPIMSSSSIFTLCLSTFDHILVTCLPVLIYLSYLCVKLLYTPVNINFKLLFHVLGISLSTFFLPCVFTPGFSLIINLCLGIYLIKKIPMLWLPADGKAVLITGCDQGIGHELAKKLDSLGFQVFAGCLFKDGAGEKELVDSCSSRLQTVQLDVRDTMQIDLAVKEVTSALGNNKLWGIVNNAGICYIGNVEMMTVEDMQKIMAVNYFGPVNICKAFLPLLRRSKGRLVNIASNAGLAPIPLMGVYCASKAALASMTEVWRYELQAWGIKVSMIIPSGYKTGILNYDKVQTAERWWTAANDTVKRDYGKECFYVKFKMPDHESVLNSDLTSILDAMVDALLSHDPQPWYYRGLLSRCLPFLYLHLPTFIGDQIIKLMADWFDFMPQALIRDSKTA